MLKFVLIISLLILSGCSSPVFVDDGKSYIDHIIDDGKAFYYTGNISLDISKSVYFMGCTDSMTTHFNNFEVISSGTPITIELYENPTVISNGSLVNSYNINRNSNNSPTLLVYGSTNVSNDGTLLLRSVILGTENKAVGIFDEALNWILKNNECYVFKITNNDNQKVNIYSNFFWYED